MRAVALGMLLLLFITGAVASSDKLLPCSELQAATAHQKARDKFLPLLGEPEHPDHLRRTHRLFEAYVALERCRARIWSAT